MSKRALADSFLDADQFADADQHYLEAMLSGETTPDVVAERWLCSRMYRTIEDGRAVLRAHPESIGAHKMFIQVLLGEKQYQTAVRVATEAIAMFGDIEQERQHFALFRLDAAVRGERLHPPTNWEQVRSDLSYVWKAYARQTTGNRRRTGATRIQDAIVRGLLQTVSAPAVPVLHAFAAEIGRTHADYARVLRSHAETISLYISATRPPGSRRPPHDGRSTPPLRTIRVRRPR